MKLIKLHFVGFVDEGHIEDDHWKSYIDTVLYDPVYIRADKIATIYPHEDDAYPVPRIKQQCIDEDENLIEMVVDNFIVLTNKDYKQASVVTFDADYTACLKKDLRHQSRQPYTRDYLVYESPEEIIRLINGEDVPVLINFDDLEFTVRTGNVLKSAGIDTVDKLVTSTEIDLMRIPRGGKKFINEVKEKLAKRGLSLVTNI